MDWDAEFEAFRESAGLSFTDEQLQTIENHLKKQHERAEEIRGLSIDHSVEPVTSFTPGVPPTGPSSFRLTECQPPAHAQDDTSLAFLPVTHLSRLIATKEISPVELTRIYLDRLSTVGPKLNALVTLTDALAIGQAKAAEDRQMKDDLRGPLDGVPWGAKDLFATRGYPTSWGVSPFKDRVIDTDAAVVERLDQAGAVLVGKLSLGTFAGEPIWFGGTTLNPWDTSEHAWGSSAGPGAATSAGLVGFSIGSETLGSISAPSVRNGVAGLRPTYGRVSRYGAMALSWTMDKLGPMCRTVEDCALVFDTIRGSDPRDLSSVDDPFVWSGRSIRGLRIGLQKSEYDKDDNAWRESVVQRFFPCCEDWALS
jgi:Asp-tRNA(Asn)/Glu-tRNA(Gln) amidotransferase A subunit family amidase